MGVVKKIVKQVKGLVGLDPALLELEERVKKLKAQIDGEDDWLFICAPKDINKIKCNDGSVYTKEKGPE